MNSASKRKLLLFCHQSKTEIVLTKNDANKLAMSWLERLHDAQMGHYILSEKQQGIGSGLGFFLTVFTVIITALTFYQNTSDVYKWFFAILCSFATILSAIQSFYRPSQRSEIHRSQASRYGALKRDLELLLAKKGITPTEFVSQLNEIKKEWDAVAGESPLTDFDTLKEIKKKKKQLAEDDLEPVKLI
ncbi:SLATT domain-containing protein [Halodesulfovibrio sp.]|uniref:SLATT domain-containing protein n=1 Tax=Halodesulfovibrio sp. TaxID=1912772 RepID=UPI0025FDEC7C|nr:SLATT domain-containing protein [Halodesulfovibrio sp.]MCT4627723.1 SLATT domain-containing protein [Halodesulfovibrio sp.]